MQFSDIQAFIEARDPGFSARVRGVARAEIAECEQRLGVQLPAAYVDFLVAMGEDSGDYKPFGPSRVHAWRELLAEAPRSDYPRDRYFKVGSEEDEECSPVYDLMVDLRRAEGADPALVLYEDGGIFEETALRPYGQGLLECLAASAWVTFEGLRRADNRQLVVHARPAGALATTHSACVALLARHGIAELALPKLPTLSCLQGGGVSARVNDDRKYDLVHVDLAGDDSTALERLVASFVANLPGAHFDPQMATLLPA